MCSTNDRFDVSLGRCEHGTYHLSIASVSIRMNEDQLARVFRVIEKCASMEPTLLGQFLLRDSAAHDDDD